MIGNDVVDLGDDDSVVQSHPVGFDARVFAGEELERLADSGEPEVLRWSMWAAKEAAYKLLRADGANVVFAPSRFVVRPRGDDTATVEIGDRTLAVDYHSTTAYVHAIARCERAFSRRCACARTRVAGLTPGSAAGVAENDEEGSSPGEAVRRLAMAGVARQLGEDAANLSIGRDGRIPVMLLRGRRLAGSLSLSHHGRFVAFAWSPAVTRS